MPSRLKLLIVDDNALIRQLLRGILRESSMEVVGEAHDGHSAMHLIELHTPHIVLLDIMLEEQNGIDILTAIKSAHPEMIVVMISTAASSDNVRRSLAAGADGFLVKPFNPARVLDELKHAIAHALARTGINAQQ